MRFLFQAAISALIRFPIRICHLPLLGPGLSASVRSSANHYARPSTSSNPSRKLKVSVFGREVTSAWLVDLYPLISAGTGQQSREERTRSPLARALAIRVQHPRCEWSLSSRVHQVPEETRN